MAKMHISACIFLIVVSIPAHAASPRKAKCLLEVNGVHYLGGICRFVPIDKRGSFRIVDMQGLGLIAQVISTNKDKGLASWNGPIGGNSPAKDLGTAYRVQGCWEADDSKICAWSLKEQVSLEPTPIEDAKNIVYWGSRVGMYTDIVSKDGLDTDHARIKTAPSRNGAIIFCRVYSRDYSVKCIKEQLETQVGISFISADCPAKEFIDFEGQKHLFLGQNGAQKDEYGTFIGETQANYLIQNVRTGEILDGSSASGYYVEKGIFKALCPSALEHDLDAMENDPPRR